MYGVLGGFTFLLSLDTCLISPGVFVCVFISLDHLPEGRGLRCYTRCLWLMNPRTCRFCMNPWKRASLSPIRWESSGWCGETGLRYKEDRFRAQNLSQVDGSPSLKSNSFFRDDFNSYIHLPTLLFFSFLNIFWANYFAISSRYFFTPGYCNSSLFSILLSHLQLGEQESSLWINIIIAFLVLKFQ